MDADKVYSIEELRLLALRRLPKAFFDFYDGGAGDEVTLRLHRQAFEEITLRPRLFGNATLAHTSLECFGAIASMPVAVAPTGGVGFGWPNGDLDSARAAALTGIPFTLSTMSTVAIEKLAKEVGERLWFQLYALQSRIHFDALIERADHAGYEALMITVDVPMPGKRERDLRDELSMPYRPGLRHVLDFGRRPGCLLKLLRNGIPCLGKVPGSPLAGKLQPMTSVSRHLASWLDMSTNKAIRDSWPRKLMVKGVSHPDDGQMLVSIGVDALVVSNHGGRQLDGQAASLDLLPVIRSKVSLNVPVLLGGGIRRGVDILKELALDADGVLVGRAPLYGTVAMGFAGAARALGLLHEELVRSIQACGVSQIADITGDILLPQSARAHGVSYQ